MKHIISASMISIIAIISACGGRSQSDSYVFVEHPDSIINAPYVNDLVATLDSGLIGKHILARGRVTNVKQSNKHCLISNDETSIRLDAKGDIVGFNKELIGNEITVYGVLCEKRFYGAELQRLKKVYTELLEVAKSDSASVAECERITSDLSDVKMMYQWITDNKKAYYSILSIDTEDYTILN